MPETSGARRLPKAALLTAAVLLAGGCAGGSRAAAPGARPVRPPAAARSAAIRPPAPGQVPSTPMVPFVSPVQPYNKPTPVPADTNGEMPSGDLVGVAPDCVADRAAAPSLGLLLATAREEGVLLTT